MKRLNNIVTKLCRANDSGVVFPEDLSECIGKPSEISSSELNDAFLIVMCGLEHPDYHRAASLLEEAEKFSEHRMTARFYLDGLRLIKQEISR